MCFIVLWDIELKLGTGVEDRPMRFESIFLKQSHQRSKVIRRSSCFRNALWPPNVVGRTPDWSVVHCWGQRSYKGQLVSTRVKLFRNALWLKNLVGKTSAQSEVQCWGQRSYRDQPGSTRGGIAQECPMATKFGRKNPELKWCAMLGSKIIQWSFKVNQIVQECPIASKFGRKNP